MVLSTWVGYARVALVGIALTGAACSCSGGGGGGETDGATETLTDGPSGTDDNPTVGDGSTSGIDTTDSETDTDDTGTGPGDRIVCDREVPAAPAGEVCDVTPGSDDLLLEGTVLAGEVVYENGTVLVDGSSPAGTIMCVGCDCGDEPRARAATRVACAEGVITPSLINPHDHITFTLSQPQRHGTERYDHRHDWRIGANGHTEIDTYPGPDSSREGILFGELRMLLGGATSITGSVGNGSAQGLLRNLDSAELTEGLTGVDVDYRTFPLGDTNGQTQTASCNYPSIDAPNHLDNDIYLPHIAEGINAAARNEFSCLSGAPGGEDLIASNTSIVHGIGVLPSDIAELGAAGGMLVWSPRSNIDLYGITADITTYRNLGVTIALGTDWSASGSMNVLRELQCADSFNRDHLNSAFSDRDLWQMSTFWAARSQGASDQIGVIAEGRVGDIAIFDGSQSADYRAIIDGTAADVALVLRGGRVLHGDARIVANLVLDESLDGCEVLDVCGIEKRVCVELDTGLSISDITTAVNPDAYPLFFCGEPDNEPSCDPLRPDEFPLRGGPGDSDGDGVADANDNCPDVFNPIRPLDGTVQSDADGDDLGDVCDLCPLEAGETCRLPDPNDHDGDGVPDLSDNCPDDPNPDQADSENDGVGDVCDACPDVPNPGNGACPASIYEVKDGTVEFGATVSVEDVVVTAGSAGYGFFVQVHPDDPGYAGADWSGLFVYQGGGSTPPAIGDRVTVVGGVTDFFGQTQLVASGPVTVLSSANDLPPPELASATEIAAGGADQEALEGVLVRVTNVSVTDVSPPPGPADPPPTGEFEVANGLRVNDLFYAPDPFPTLGQNFSELVGIARWANDLGKLEPRSIEDYPAGLVAFGDELVYLLEGSTGVPIPGLSVQLSAPVSAPTAVALTYENPAIVSGPATVTIATGNSSAAVSLTGGSVGEADVTASFDGNAIATTVRVYSDAEPRIPTLAPGSVTTSIGQSATLTVALNLPAPAGGQGVNLVAAPAGVVTVPATITVPGGTLSATFAAVAGGSTGLATVTASIGGASSNASVDVTSAPTFPDLVIVEVYYDHQGGDDQYEWVKLYNGTGQPVNLSGYSLGFGGTSLDDGTLALSGTMQNGECFVVGGPLGDATNGFPGGPDYDLALDFSPDLQNSNPEGVADGIGIFDIPASSITPASIPVDAAIWGAVNSNNLPDENGPGGVVDVADAPSASSVHRLGNDAWAVNPNPAPLSCLPFPSP